MNVIPLLVACSLLLVACAVGLFVWSVCRGEHDHADRLSLLPLEDDLNDPENA
jgi:nitrogen fixation-related uncharacterized protein